MTARWMGVETLKAAILSVAEVMDFVIRSTLDAAPGKMTDRGQTAGGVAEGALLPIVLTSRADSGRRRIASCAAAVLVTRARHTTGPGRVAGGAA